MTSLTSSHPVREIMAGWWQPSSKFIGRKKNSVFFCLGFFSFWGKNRKISKEEPLSYTTSHVDYTHAGSSVFFSGSPQINANCTIKEFPVFFYSSCLTGLSFFPFLLPWSSPPFLFPFLFFLLVLPKNSAGYCQVAFLFFNCFLISFYLNSGKE